MSRAKPLTKELIVAAMSRTKSNRSAARYLSVSFQHYKKWAKLYKDEATGVSLWEKHKNQSGSGIPKFLSAQRGGATVREILEGKASPHHYTPEKLKHKFIAEGYLAEECSRCKMVERRVLDYKMPLLLNFKDGNKKNYQVWNLELLCYNCYFVTVGDIFDNRQIQGLEDHITIYKQEHPDWQLDDYHLERLRELGLLEPEQPEKDYISRI